MLVKYQFKNNINENELISFAIVRDIDLIKNGLHLIVSKHLNLNKL